MTLDFLCNPLYYLGSEENRRVKRRNYENTGADMKKVVSLEDVLYVLEKYLATGTEYVTIDLGDAGHHDVPIDVAPHAIELVEKMYEFAEER